MVIGSGGTADGTSTRGLYVVGAVRAPSAPPSRTVRSFRPARANRHVFEVDGTGWNSAPFEMEPAGVGLPRALELIGRDTALIGWVDDWALQRVSDPRMGQLSVQDLDLGPGAGSRLDPVRSLYTATAGGSWWDADVTW